MRIKRDIAVGKYQSELIEILEELTECDPSIISHIGLSRLFNWRAIFDFSSNAWTEFSSSSRTIIINALAERRTLFIALMTFKSMYLEMNRPDIANAAGLSLAKYFEDLSEPIFVSHFSPLEMASSENIY